MNGATVSSKRYAQPQLHIRPRVGHEWLKELPAPAMKCTADSGRQMVTDTHGVTDIAGASIVLYPQDRDYSMQYHRKAASQKS